MAEEDAGHDQRGDCEPGDGMLGGGVDVRGGGGGSGVHCCEMCERLVGLRVSTTNAERLFEEDEPGGESLGGSMVYIPHFQGFHKAERIEGPGVLWLVVNGREQ